MTEHIEELKGNELVLIEWVDSIRPQSSWQLVEDIDDPDCVKIQSVGWVLKESESAIVLAPNVGNTNDGESLQASGHIQIPKRAIQQRVILSPLSSDPGEGRVSKKRSKPKCCEICRAVITKGEGVIHLARNRPIYACTGECAVKYEALIGKSLPWGVNGFVSLQQYKIKDSASA